MEGRHADFLRRYTKVQLVIRRYVFAHVQDVHAAEDVLQDVAVTLWKKYAEYDSTRSFTKWALGVARYAILHSRRTAARSRLALTDEVDQIIVDRLTSMGPELDERVVLLRSCLQKLPEKQRRVIGLKYEKRMSCEQVSERAGTSVEAIRTLLCRIRRALLDCIRKHSEVRNGAAT